MTRFSDIRLEENEIPSLEGGTNLSKMNLTPKEGFVLSRVDGRTSLGQIATICGLPMAEIMTIFSKFLILRAVKMKPNVAKKEQPRRKDRLSIIEQLDEDENYDTLKGIPREDRRGILIMEEDIAVKNWYEILGVDRHASDEQIKKGYFRLTKEFHPDKYFGKELGIYKRKLEAIFQWITDIFEVLSDKDKRREYDAKLFPAAGKANREAKQEDQRYRPKTLIEKLAEAKKFYALGETELKKGNVSQAYSYFQIAITYDPANLEYKKVAERMQPSLDKKRAKARYDEAVKKQEMGDIDGAYKLIEEAVSLDPSGPDYNYAMAKLLVAYNKDHARAKDFCLKALESMGDKAEARILMGKIYKRIGMTKNAVREFKLALKLDKKNNDAKMELEELE